MNIQVVKIDDLDVFFTIIPDPYEVDEFKIIGFGENEISSLKDAIERQHEILKKAEKKVQNIGEMISSRSQDFMVSNDFYLEYFDYENPNDKEDRFTNLFFNKKNGKFERSYR